MADKPEAVVGYDLGTMNMVSATLKPNNKIAISNIRNMFTEIDTSTISLTDLQNTDLDYVKYDDGDEQRIFVIGEDSFKFNQLFGQTPRRPMKDGVISSEDIDAIDILTLMTQTIIKKRKDKEDPGYCVYSVPAQSVDVDNPPVLYHEKVFSKVMKTLGYESKALNEASAVVFSNCEKENFSGIGISFGCGLTNVACMYRGINTLSFSVKRGGDWIDNNVATSVNVPVARVTNIKEKLFDLEDISFKKAKKKSERKVLQGLAFFYEDLISYVLKVIHKQFEENADVLSIDEEIPIIVSGGTSLPNGFVETFRDVFNSLKTFPYDISEIRRAHAPLSDVATGCLINALWDIKQLESGTVPKVDNSPKDVKKVEYVNMDQKEEESN